FRNIPPKGLRRRSRRSKRNWLLAREWEIARRDGEPARQLPPGDQAPEDGAVLEAVPLGALGGVLLHAGADRLPRRDVEARYLALVTDEGGHLLVDPPRDVDDDFRLVHAPVPELAHAMRLELVVRDVLGKVQVIA